MRHAQNRAQARHFILGPVQHIRDAAWPAARKGPEIAGERRCGLIEVRGLRQHGNERVTGPHARPIVVHRHRCIAAIAILLHVLHHALPGQRRDAHLQITGRPVDLGLHTLHLDRGQLGGAVTGPALAQILCVVAVDRHTVDVGQHRRIAEDAESGAGRRAQPVPEILHTTEVHVTWHCEPDDSEHCHITLILCRLYSDDHIATLDRCGLGTVQSDAMT